MTHSRQTLLLASPDVTADIAQTIASALRPGDCLLLEGPIGAGKTHFARHLIQSLLESPEDVPSPTFTLIQTYQVPVGEIWHADLYRLSSLDEVEELGLLEAIENEICLIEWPDRLAELTPKQALHLSFSLDPDHDDSRHLCLRWQDEKWKPLVKALIHD